MEPRPNHVPHHLLNTSHFKKEQREYSPDALEPLTPQLLAEQLEVAAVVAHMGSTDVRMRRAWRAIDMALATPEVNEDRHYIAYAEAMLESIRYAPLGSTYRDVLLAGIMLVYLPAFQQRAIEGTVKEETMHATYQGLGAALRDVTDQDGYTRSGVEAGLRAEILAKALCARLRHERYFLYISSDREESTQAVDGRSFSTDAHAVHSDGKLGVQIKNKKNKGRHAYHPSIVVLRTSYFLPA